MTPDFFDALESQLVDAAARGEAPRRRRFRLRLARLISTPLTVTAIAVAASATAIAAGLSSPLAHLGSGAAHAHAARVHVARVRPHASAVAAPAATAVAAGIPAGGPVPSGFQPQSFTAISELSWWLLGPAPCSSPPCTSIVRTTDGGASFVGLPAPRTSHVDGLRFADEQDGWAYGPQLWATHDGGQTWRRLHPGGEVGELAAADGYVYALVWHGSRRWLARSPVGSDAFKRLRLGHGVEPFSLWVGGRELVVDGQSPTGVRHDVMVSRDAGARFARAGVAPPSLVCGFQSTSARVIWAPCVTGTLSGVWRSTNGGRTFHSALGPERSLAALDLPNAAVFAAASGSLAVVGYRHLFRTTNAGRHWRRVAGLPTPEEWTYLGFTDHTHGLAIGHFSTRPAHGWRLYYTTDAAASYHRVSIDP